MIRRLRVKFVAVNMTIVTIMLCVILGLMFYFTRANLETESIVMMKNLAVQPLHPFLPADPTEDVRLPYFVVQLGPNGTVLSSDGGFFDLSDNEFLTSLVDNTMREAQSQGIVEEYHLRYYRADTPMGQRLVFADMTSEVSTLNSLTQTCTFVGVVSFLAFLTASIFLSKWAVRPVEQAWRQQRQFVADASHELKTPLAVITTNAEMLNSPGYDAMNREQFSANILTMARQMRGLVEQLLQLARSDASDHKIEVREVALSSLVERAALPFEATFFEKGLTLELQVEPDITISGDESQLRQIVEILLDNAQKYASPGGCTWVCLKRQAKTCVLTVKNQGEPIPKQELPNLFKRFYRTDEARSRDGSFGLGLSIAESIAVRHKGKIWAESGEGLNSFHVELPRCQ